LRATGAELVVRALEAVGVRWTFGIPGVHNTELYDALASSKRIKPILVTHEGGGAFMADAVSRVSDGIGTLAIVPAAGATHAASGLGEAFLAGVPMLVICGGIRTDLPFKFQLHEIDQHKFLAALTKRSWKVATHAEIMPTIFEAHRLAVSGEPGPVFVEVPVNLLLFVGEAGDLPAYAPPPPPAAPDPALIQDAAKRLRAAKRPAIFAGWGAREASEELQRLADMLDAPVATTLQGLSVFPATHSLHVGFGFGPAAVPAARNAFAEVDCLLAVGTRFGEIATGSFGATPPANLIHIDINPSVLGANYPTAVALPADAKAALTALIAALGNDAGAEARAASVASLRNQITADKDAYRAAWFAHDPGERVNPISFFDALAERLPEDTIVVVDDGNHTFLAAELLPIRRAKGFIGPTDFNCMGYAVPGAIGAKIARPEAKVVAIVGDGAFTMTCMELLTASRNGVGVTICVFNDGELAQIAQAQRIPYARATCTTIEGIDIAGVAQATGAAYLALARGGDSGAVLDEADRIAASGRPVIVDVRIDYSRKTAFTEGAVKTNLARLPLGAKMRIIGRALWRRVFGAK